MRKALEFVSLLGLAAIAGFTFNALVGPHGFGNRVPTHFDAGGRPNGWGSPWILLVLPISALVIYLLMTLVSRYPGAFNYPVRVTPANHARLQSLALEMIAWLKAEIVWLFAIIQIATVRAARTGHIGLSPRFMPLALGVVFATIIGYISAMRRTKPSPAKLPPGTGPGSKV
jgi:uncharacterized membrane protein